MIADKDRSGYIGASDTDKVMGNWKTKTWLQWWMQKLGINTDRFENRFTKAGTNWEHRILESLQIPGMTLDEQIIHENLRLRVNYDGTTDSCIYECKTYQWEKGFHLPKKYIQQVQVQMYSRGTYRATLVAYGLEEADYDNYLRPVDPGRRQEFDIVYDPSWINTEYLPRLRRLAECLNQGKLPAEAM